MHAILLGVTWGILGLDSGWRALPGGGVEYILQIAPQELEVFKEDKTIEVDIPAELPEIHSFRVVVGNEILPREKPSTSRPAAAKGSNPRGSPDFSANPLAQRKSTAYNPFAALASSWERYPLPRDVSETRNTAHSTTRTMEKDAPNPNKTSFDPEPEQTRLKSERPASREFRQEPAKETAREIAKEIKEPPPSWGPFTIVIVALLGSLGGNVYMVWITRETRARYHDLVRRRNEEEHSFEETKYESDAEGEDE